MGAPVIVEKSLEHDQLDAVEDAAIWQRVAAGLQQELNDAYVIAGRWQGEALESAALREIERAEHAARAAAIAALTQRAEALDREVRALREANARRERMIVRQGFEIRDLTRRLPQVKQHVVTPAEAFRVTHPIADVIGKVVALEPVEKWRARKFSADAVQLEKPGSYLVGQCPFHDDDHGSASLVVRPWFQQFACQICGEHGDVIQFIRLMREVRDGRRDSR